MPITKQAAKKLRHDHKRTKQTMAAKKTLRDAVKGMRKKPTVKSLAGIFQVLDKAAKRKIIHPNKADRLKSKLSKLLAKK